MNGVCPCKGPEHDPGCRYFESAEDLWLRLVGVQKQEARHWRRFQEAQSVYTDRLQAWLQSHKVLSEIKRKLP